MIQHIVLLKLKPGITGDDVMGVFQAGKNLADDIPGVVRWTIGMDHTNPDHGFTLASITYVEDEDALREYLASPVRSRYIEEHVDPITDQRIELDVPVQGTHRPSGLTSWTWAGSVQALAE
jgi:hypothetical protein